MHTLHNFGGCISTPTIRDLNKSIAANYFTIVFVAVTMIVAVGRAIEIVLQESAKYTAHIELAGMGLYFGFLCSIVIILGIWYIIHLTKETKADKRQKKLLTM